MSDLHNSRAVLAALKGLQDKVRCLEEERSHSVEDVQTLKRELARREEDSKYSQQLQELTTQEHGAAARLSYERLLADKRAVDVRLDETEAANRELRDACETTRDHGQDAHVAQLAAEAKVSILERRIEECEQMARARNDRCLRARKTVHRETAMADAQLSALAARIESLQRTLRDERAIRKLAQTNYRRAQGTNARTSHYLDSILRVNQELVATRAAAPAPLPKPARRSSSPRRMGEPSRLRRRKVARKKNASEQRGDAVSDEIDVGASVAEACRVGRAGGDPVPFLQALYERIGFSALQRDDGEGGTQSLPTSPSRARAAGTLDEARFQDEDEDFLSFKLPVSVAVGGFFPIDDVEGMKSPGRRTRRNEKLASGSGEGGGGRGAAKRGTVAMKGYSFAHSPKTMPTSVAERSPQVIRRLEALASQLERERADVEQWYKTVVHRASPGAQKGGAGADLDAKSLTRAIASLQEKAQQLEVVHESLDAFKASPQMPVIHSPTACRRKVAALHVLQGLCQDVAGEERSGAGAA